MLWPEGMAPFTLKREGDVSKPQSHHDMIFETAEGYITVGTVSDAGGRACVRHSINLSGSPIQDLRPPHFVRTARSASTWLPSVY